MTRGPKRTLSISISDKEREMLESWMRSTTMQVGLVKRGHVILLLAAGKSIKEVIQLSGMGRPHIYKWAKRFSRQRIDGLKRAPHPRPPKMDNPRIKLAVFSVLHSPPSEYNINRTSWRLDDLKKSLLQEGIFASKNLIRQILKSGGYKWRKARTVLTSKDPRYREKVKHIQSILANLAENEAFFSIDEFGPVSIKMKGGKRLVAPHEYPYVYQSQKSKGKLIITAALDLSSNQIIHFYSKKKNTDEMFKLLIILLNKYKQLRKLYLSWDAASWHVSKELYNKVTDLNNSKYRKQHPSPVIDLVPLPKTGQFLNVIESVFSGMAKAIIHNSNYRSLDEAKLAIDRYFEERNEYFKRNPKKAGKKIWKYELVNSIFSEDQNCKDPRWR